jgi:hypothetical protein
LRRGRWVFYISHRVAGSEVADSAKSEEKALADATADLKHLPNHMHNSGYSERMTASFKN